MTQRTSKLKARILVDIIQSYIDSSSFNSEYSADQLSEYFIPTGRLFGLIDKDNKTTEVNISEICRINTFFDRVRLFAKRELTGEEIKSYLLPYKFEGLLFIDISIFNYLDKGHLLTPISLFFFGFYMDESRAILNIGSKTYHSELLVQFYSEGEKLLSKSFNKSFDSDSKTYILRDIHSGHYKIGRSNSPSARFKGINTMNPGTILLMYCHANIENKLHQKYAIKRQTGEWFALSESDLLEIVDEFTEIGGEFFNNNQI